MFRSLLVAAACLITLSASAQAAIIGVDFGPGGGSGPAGWTYDSNQVSHTLFDLNDENLGATTVDLILGLPGAGTSNSTIPAGQVPTHTNPLGGLDGNFFTLGGTMTLRWSGLNPGAAYQLWVFGNDTIAYNNNVSITGGGGPVNFSQSAGANGLYVNGLPGSNASLDSFAVQQTADGAGQILVSISNGSGVGVAGGAIQEVVPVPEPTTYAMLVVFGAGAVMLRRLRRQSA